jgi:hypothetical protein
MWRVVGIRLKLPRVSGEVEVYRPAYSPRQYLREVSRAPPAFYLWERIPVSMARVFSWSQSLRSVRLQTLTNCHVYWDGLPPQYLFTWICVGVSFYPTWVPVPFMAAKSWCFQIDSCGAVTALPLQLLLCTEPELFVAGCWCASVRFSSFLAEARPVLWTCL